MFYYYYKCFIIVNVAVISRIVTVTVMIITITIIIATMLTVITL